MTKSDSRMVVKASSIDSRGVFAVSEFQEGDVVLTWDATREISDAQFQALSCDDRQYIDIQKGKILLVGEPERYVNHSCDPNTRPGDRCDIACRHIAPGEEITADYALYNNPGLRFECRCGAPKCRGLIA